MAQTEACRFWAVACIPWIPVSKNLFVHPVLYSADAQAKEKMMQQQLLHESTRMIEVAKDNAETLRQMHEHQQASLEHEAQVLQTAAASSTMQRENSQDELEDRMDTHVEGKIAKAESSQASGALFVNGGVGESGGWRDDGWMRQILVQMEAKIEKSESARLEHSRRLDSQLAEITSALHSVAKKVERMCSSIESARHHADAATDNADMPPLAPSSSPRVFQHPPPPQHPAPHMQRRDAHVPVSARSNGFGVSMLDEAAVGAIADEVAAKIGVSSTALGLDASSFNHTGPNFSVSPSMSRRHSMPARMMAHDGDMLANAIVTRLRQASGAFAGDNSNMVEVPSIQDVEPVHLPMGNTGSQIWGSSAYRDRSVLKPLGPSNSPGWGSHRHDWPEWLSIVEVNVRVCAQDCSRRVIRQRLCGHCVCIYVSRCATRIFDGISTAGHLE